MTSALTVDWTDDRECWKKCNDAWVDASRRGEIADPAHPYAHYRIAQKTNYNTHMNSDVPPLADVCWTDVVHVNATTFRTRTGKLIKKEPESFWWGFDDKQSWGADASYVPTELELKKIAKTEKYNREMRMLA
jgi:hypothetical protein